MKDKKNRKTLKDKILSTMMVLLGNHLNYYSSYLGKPRISLASFIFRFFSPKIALPREDRKIIQDLSRKGTIIYAQRNRSSLDFLFFHHRYQIEGLPYPIFGNFINMIWWQPIKSVFRILLSKLYCKIKGNPAPNPYRTDYVARISEEGLSSILFLRQPTGLLKRFALKETDDPFVYLLRAQKTMKQTIYIIPQFIVFEKSPIREKKNIIDVLFGPREEPGLIRRIIVFLRFYRRAFIKIGDPINLNDFIKNRKNIDGELSYSLRRTLLESIEGEQRLITGPILKKRLDLIEMVMWDDDFQEEIKKISRRTDEPIENIRNRAIGYLEEIASDYNMTYVQLWDYILTWIWNNIYNGIDIDLEGLGKVREAGKKSPLILIPCHKSHMDYLLLSYVFYHHNLNPPHIAAGINLSFFPMGHIFRKSGAFFIRRTFKGDTLYPLVFTTYIKTLIKEGFSIEFFIEGGRSRTGKLVMPKLGLLSIIISAYLSGYVDDISFVPIFIGYDRIMEESSYIRELTGAKKEKETLKSMVENRGMLKKKYGRVYINFNDPISLNDMFKACGYKPTDITRPQLRQLQYDLAYRIVYSINEVSVVNPVNLVSSAFMSNAQGALLGKELIDIVEFFKDYLTFIKVNFAGSLKNHRKASLEALANLMDEKLIDEVKEESEEKIEDLDKLFFVPEDKRLHLEFYKNSILHFLLPISFAAVALLSHRSGRMSKDQLVKEYTYLRKLFKYDFIYDLQYSDSERIDNTLSYLVKKGIVALNRDQVKILKTGEDWLKIFAGLIRNYLESYLVTLASLPQHLDETSKNEKDLMKRIEMTGEKMFRRGAITRREALSSINYRNALELLTHEKVLRAISIRDGKRTEKHFVLGNEQKGFAEKIQRYLTHLGT